MYICAYIYMYVYMYIYAMKQKKHHWICTNRDIQILHSIIVDIK